MLESAAHQITCLSSMLSHSGPVNHVEPWIVCMQVCHHPPIGAAHAEGKGWTYDIVSAPTTRFNGNSVDVFPLGVCQIIPAAFAFRFRVSCSHLHNVSGTVALCQLWGNTQVMGLTLPCARPLARKQSQGQDKISRNYA